MKGQRGFTILEILIVITIIATLAAIAVPVMLRARMAANECSCIASLRTVITQEAVFARMAEVDQDGDDKGEFAWLSELSSEVCVRKDPSTPNPFPPNPPFLTSSLRTSASQGNGIAKKSGYFYRMYLAISVPVGNADDAGDDTVQDGTSSAWATPLDPATDHPIIDLQENNYVCQAWPAVGHLSGQRCFAVTAMGEIYASRMGMQSYSGENAQMADYSLGHSSNGDGSDGWWNDNLASGRKDLANDGNVYNPAQ